MMNTELIKKALQAQADAHLSERYRLQGSNYLRVEIINALDCHLEDPPAALVDDLERRMSDVITKACSEERTAAILRKEAESL